MAPQRQLVRDQHIVSRWHLKRFVDVDGWFWRYKQNEPMRRCRPKRSAESATSTSLASTGKGLAVGANNG